MTESIEKALSIALNKQELKDTNVSQIRINLDKKQPQERPNFFSYSFSRSMGITIKGVIISDDIMLEFLWKWGLSKQIPIFSDLNNENNLVFNFDVAPLAYPPQKPWPFKFNDIPCEFIVGNTQYTFRILVQDKEKADFTMKTIVILFYNECVRRLPPPVGGTVNLYRTVDVPYFQWKHASKVKRNWDTIYLEESVKDEIYDKIKFFIDSKDKYDEYCVPWKFVTLLEGIPGTGKTSLVSALACRFNLNVYILTVTPRMTSSDLQTLLSAAEGGFILIEDVDALFVERETKTNLDFSTFINCLDGLSAKAGSVIFLTTNYVEKLDAALIREGRVDHRVSFGLPTENSLRMMLKKLGSLWTDDHEKFLAAIKDKKLTIPRLQRYLFDCWRLKKTSILDDIGKL